jgi:parallel beta-helix repeat protein
MPFDVKAYGAAGTGTVNDAPAVQAAVNAAAAAAGEVIFPEGEYRLDATIAVPSGVRLRGAGGRIRKGSNVNQVILNLENAASVTVENLTIVNSGGNLVGSAIRCRGAYNISIRGNRFVALATSNIYNGGLYIDLVEACIGVRVEDNEFLNGRSALNVGTADPAAMSTDVIFIGNVVKVMKDEGIDLNLSITRAVIANNTFEDCTDPASGANEVIDVGGLTTLDVVISGNTIDLSGKAVRAISVKRAPTPFPPGSITSRIVISGNSITNGSASGGAAIYMGAVSNAVITGNTINGGYYGITLEGQTSLTVVGHNTIQNTASYAVRDTNGDRNIVEGNNIISPSTTTDMVRMLGTNWAVRNNTVAGGARGIVTVTASAEIGSPCMITNNDVSGTQDYAIVCRSPLSVVSGNRVHDNQEMGISVGPGEGCLVSGNVVYGNNLSNQPDRFGINLAGQHNGAVITGNVVRGANQGGIRFVGPTDRAIFTDNHILYNGQPNVVGLGNLTNSVVADNIT